MFQMVSMWPTVVKKMMKSIERIAADEAGCQLLASLLIAKTLEPAHTAPS